MHIFSSISNYLDEIPETEPLPQNIQCEDNDAAFVSSPKRKRKSDQITLTLPRKGLLSEISGTAARCKLTHRKTTALTANILKIGGADLKDFTLSSMISQQQRKSEIEKSEKKIKNDFKKRFPQKLILHWDSKLIKYEKRHKTDDRLAVVASTASKNQVAQFLAAPCIPDSTGSSQRDALVKVVQEWEIPHSCIIGISWDTTSSNTGIWQGSATLFEKELGNSVMWLACRHHIGELHIKHADIKTRGTWNSK